jgi:hypothetical protein
MLKQINSANPGTRRPFRISDLQDLWDSLNVLHCEDFAGTRIIFGFNVKGDDNLSAGVVAKDGKLYYHPDVTGYRIAVGSEVFGNLIDGVDERVFSDSTTQDFSFNAVASTVSSSVSLGTFTKDFIERSRVNKRYRTITGVIRMVCVGSSSVEDNWSVSFTSDKPDIDTDVTFSKYVTGYDNRHLVLNVSGVDATDTIIESIVPFYGINGTMIDKSPSTFGLYKTNDVDFRYDVTEWREPDFVDSRIAYRITVRVPL